jgi:TnpA family transposase
LTLSALSYMAAVSLLCGGNRRLDGCYRENPVALERRRATSFMEKNFVDSHGQSEVAFAFCHLLGTVRLMACLKRIKYERLYLPREKDRRRLSESGNVFARPIRWHLIEQQYDEMVKAAVALKRGTATAEAILKRYNSYNLTHPTYKALAEVGKAEKSVFLCEYLLAGDPT